MKQERQKIKKNNASNNSSIVACVFIVEVTFLHSRCPATIRVYTYKHTD
jgi:hypothetical protein